MNFKNPWIQLGLGYVSLVLFVLAASKLIHDPLDRSLLLALNPDHALPLIDTLMILITDASMFGFALVVLAWKITSVQCQKYPDYKIRAKRVYRIVGILSLPLVAYLVYRQDYTDIVVPILGSAVIFLAFWFGALSFSHWSDLTLYRCNRVFFIVLLSVLLASGFGEGFIKKTIGRPRPLNEINRDWNQGVHRFPDEICAHGNSYASGHSIALFALVTPLAWATRKRWLRNTLWLWAALHAFSRVYTAAHYPYCALMGSFFGFSVGSLVYFTVGQTILARKILEGNPFHEAEKVA